MMEARINVLYTAKTLLCFALFLNLGSVLYVFFPYQIEILIILLVCVVMILSKNFIINRRLLQILGISYIILVFSIFITNSSIADYLILFVRIPVTMLVITAFGNNYREIAKYLISALWIIMFLALVNFILVMVCPLSYYIVEAEGGYRTQTLGYLFNWLASQSILGIDIIRNQSIFWEPGILQITANILVYYVIIERKKSLQKAALPIFIVMTTISTTGFIILAFLLLMKFKSVFSLKGKGLVRTLAMTVLIGVFIPILHGEIVDKFAGDSKISSNLRMFDLYMGMSVALSHPIWGIGMNQEKMTKMTGANKIEIDGEVMLSDRGNTNSIIVMFVKLGVPLTLCLMWGLYNQSIFDMKFSFFIVLFLSLFSEPLFPVYLLLIFAMSSIKVPLGNRVS